MVCGESVEFVATGMQVCEASPPVVASCTPGHGAPPARVCVVVVWGGGGNASGSEAARIHAREQVSCSFSEAHTVYMQRSESLESDRSWRAIMGHAINLGSESRYLEGSYTCLVLFDRSEAILPFITTPM